MGGITVTQRFRIAKIISSKTISQIEPKLDGRHRSIVEIQNCSNRFVLISKMAPWRPLWNSSNDISSQTVSGIEPNLDGRHRRDTEVQNCFKWHLLPNWKLDWAETWWGVSEQQRDAEFLKSFHYDIQDGPHGGHLENIQTLSALEWYDRLSQKLVGGIWVTWRFRIAIKKNILLRYPLWPTQQQSWSSWRSYIVSFAPGQLMPWSVDHGLSLIRMSVSNFLHFRHHHQNRIHDGCHCSHLESFQFYLLWKVNQMERKLGGRHLGSMEI